MVKRRTEFNNETEENEQGKRLNVPCQTAAYKETHKKKLLQLRTCRSLSFAEVAVDGLQLGCASFNRVEAADLVPSDEQVVAGGRFSRQCHST